MLEEELDAVVVGRLEGLRHATQRAAFHRDQHESSQDEGPNKEHEQQC